MSFRRTVFIALSLAALVMVVLEGSLDLFLDRVADRQDRLNSARLETVVDEVVEVIFSGPPPMDETRDLHGGTVRYTVRLGEAGVPTASNEGDIPFWRTSERWLRSVRTLGFARFVEVEVELNLTEYILANRLLLDVIDLPVFFLIAMVTAYVLTRLIARPVKRLTEGTRGLAARRFGQTVPVPPGDDELSELAISFNAMSHKIQDFLDRERAFSRYVSHELRTPLSALRLQIDRAVLGHAPADTVLPVLSRQVGRMEGIVEGLLALSRMSDPDPLPRPLDLVVDESLTVVAPESRQRLVLVNRSPSASKVTHGKLLQRALGNLVDNALTHGTGTATVTLWVDGEHLTVSVNDEGPGVPDEDLHRLTEPFVRLGSDDPGLGLGLSLVALIARALDGQLQLRNTGSGMEAALTLPIVVPS